MIDPGLTVVEVETNPQSKAIVRAVPALGNSLEISVLAEGIETEAQLTLLGVEGCDEAQGYAGPTGAAPAEPPWA